MIKEIKLEAIFEELENEEFLDMMIAFLKQFNNGKAWRALMNVMTWKTRIESLEELSKYVTDGIKQGKFNITYGKKIYQNRFTFEGYYKSPTHNKKEEYIFRAYDPSTNEWYTP